MKNRIEFGIIGGGWRAEFFLRIAKQLPERFAVTAMLVRNPGKGKIIEKEWGVKTYENMNDFVSQGKFSFVVVSVPGAVAGEIVTELTKRQVPALLETPPAPTVEAMTALYHAVGPDAKVQVAEQYAFQPIHAARINLINSGRLGTISQARVSVAHDYHGVSLMRKFLGIGYENANISGFSFAAPLVGGPNREGPPKEEKINMSGHSIASLEFDGKLGVYDFSFDQYMSYIRSPRVLVRGEKGEINNKSISYLQDFKTPVYAEFQRHEAGQDGNLEGMYLKGIIAGSEWLYKNPFIPGRLSDDEIAIATCLDKMQDMVDGGPEFYPLAEAMQDTYLGLMITKSIKTGEGVTTTKQAWAG